MTDTIEVHIGTNSETHLVGICRYIAKRTSQSSLFQYEGEWLDRPDAFAIDPVNLPLQPSPFHHTSSKSALPCVLRDTAPDRWGQKLIQRAFLKADQDRSLNEMDYLLGISDAARVGALRYRVPGTTTFDHDEDHRTVPPLITLPMLLNAADAVHADTETAEDLRLLLNEGSPLGGARPKASVQDGEALSIAKFPKEGDPRSIIHGEILALTLAAKAGMNVAQCRLVKATGRPVALITRFDRDGERRIPFASAMTLLGLEDGDEAAYTDIAANIIRPYSSAMTKDLHELWRRIVFSVLISNFDDHLRNHAFLYDGNGLWRLSPAYDLNPVPKHEGTGDLKTWISEGGPKADLELALEAAAEFALTDAKARAIIDEVTAVVRTWRDTARDIGMCPADIKAKVLRCG